MILFAVEGVGYKEKRHISFGNTFAEGRTFDHYFLGQFDDHDDGSKLKKSAEPYHSDCPL